MILAGVLGVLVAAFMSCDGCEPEHRHHARVYCGNGICDYNEGCDTCPYDCGACAGCVLPDFNINCEQFHDFNTTNRGDFLNTYNCPGWAGVNESGSDVVYQITTSSTCDLTAIVSSGVDLDTFILDSWNGQGCADQCLAAGDFWAINYNAPPGVYDIAVDGYAGAEGAYTLDVVCSVCGDLTCDGVEGCLDCPADCGACPCAAPDYSLAVNASDTRTTVGFGNRLDLYACEESRPWVESGPDVIYQVVTGGVCDLTATLSGISVDLDVFIIAQSGGQACADNCLAPGNTQAVYFSAPAGTYDVVVDGYQGAQGSYTLTVTCP
jgi:hypothetical protein